LKYNNNQCNTCGTGNNNLARPFVENQIFNKMYDPKTALKCGTIFPELYLLYQHPFPEIYLKDSNQKNKKNGGKY
jgi:hypothetical protein